MPLCEDCDVWSATEVRFCNLARAMQAVPEKSRPWFRRKASWTAAGSIPLASSSSTRTVVAQVCD